MVQAMLIHDRKDERQAFHNSWLERLDESQREAAENLSA